MEGWIKINTDGSLLGNPEIAGYGGSLRNSDGRWVAGFAVNLRHYTAYQVEFWGVHHDLKTA
ncbi:hypothetical protein AHAS_Ahas10G0116900 [Arachis hypogaea]